jgi:hypothetical protein
MWSGLDDYLGVDATVTTSDKTYGPESAKPTVCSPAVVSTELDSEFVVVNTETKEAHALEGDVAIAWRAVQAGTQPDLPREQTDEIIDALIERGLLLVEEGYSRRSLLKAGAAAFALAGITSIALPAGALAAASHTITVNGTMITLLGGQTTTFTLIGGGGGGGASDGMAAGGSGGAGGIVNGTIKNTGASATLTVDIGAGGSGGINNMSATTGGTGWSGSTGGGTDGSGGGDGGGASAILSGATVLIIAGGGGGGDVDNGNTTGLSGTSGSTTGASTAGGTPTQAMGGVGGGGAGGTPGTAGNVMTTQSTGGTSYPAAPFTTGNFMITISGSALGSAGAAGTAGPINGGAGGTGGTGGNGEAFFEGGVS